MRLAVLYSAAFILGVIIFAACNSKDLAGSRITVSPQGSPSPQNPSDSARRITAAELHDLFNATEVSAKVGELPRDKMIVTYCT